MKIKVNSCHYPSDRVVTVVTEMFYINGKQYPDDSHQMMKSRCQMLNINYYYDDNGVVYPASVKREILITIGDNVMSVDQLRSSSTRPERINATLQSMVLDGTIHRVGRGLYSKKPIPYQQNTVERVQQVIKSLPGRFSTIDIKYALGDSVSAVDIQNGLRTMKRIKRIGRGLYKKY